ncbi:MAG: histidinol-phosphate transaminase [Muribaculaceae bacterium]|nr:histidinol-phosphate transaminase [Muribaculaceae bacterium]
MKNPLKYVRKNLLALAPYSTARDEFKGGDISVWLDANESPYDNGLNRYPDPHQHQLKHHIAELKGVRPEQIFIGGAGSDEAIDLVYRVFCRPGEDNVVAIAPSYGVYSVAAAINDVEFREVQLRSDFSLPVNRLLKAADSRTKVIWICSPNNPTANAFPRADIARIAEAFEGIVVVDEAYIDFSDRGSMLDVIDNYPNVIVLQTFSKAWGLASLRLGMAFACEEIAQIFAKVKYPYNVNGPTQKAIIDHIINSDISENVSEIKKQRELLANSLNELPIVKKVFPSDANFLLVKFDSPDSIYDYLVENGVIVRNRSKLISCEGCLRITIGIPEENARVITLLKEYTNKE